ncbi:glutamine amidotransferase-related protein [Microbacterium sp. GXF7504]
MDPRPLLYVCVRPQRGAAEGEYRSFRNATGLGPDRLHELDLVRNPLPAGALDRYAGFLVGGSPFNATDPDRSEVQRRLEADLETIAAAATTASGPAAMFTCYGIGVVTRMLGGTVTRDYPEGTTAAEIELTDAGADDPVFGVMQRVFQAFTAHKESSTTAPADAVLLATNPACPVQAYRVGDRLYATQFHPEPTARDFTERMVFYRDAGYFAAEAFDAVAARVLAADVSEPARMLRAFATRYAPA